MSSKKLQQSFRCFILQIPLFLLASKAGIEATMNYPNNDMRPMNQYHQHQQQQMMYPNFKYQMRGPQPYSEQQPYSTVPFEGKYRYPKPGAALKKSTILVESAHSSPINLLFRSFSSSVNVMQDHSPSKGLTRYMNSEEEPLILVMNITKPILQRVNEVILPQRQIKQIVFPIEEKIETIIKDDGHRIKPQFGKDDDMGGGNGGYQDMKSIENYVNFVVSNEDEQQQQLHPDSAYKQKMANELSMSNDHRSDPNFGGNNLPNQNEQNHENFDNQMNLHNSNVEPVFRESQNVYSKHKPDTNIEDKPETTTTTPITTVAPTESKSLLASSMNSTAKV